MIISVNVILGSFLLCNSKILAEIWKLFGKKRGEMGESRSVAPPAPFPSRVTLRPTLLFFVRIKVEYYHPKYTKSLSNATLKSSEFVRVNFAFRKQSNFVAKHLSKPPGNLHKIILFHEKNTKNRLLLDMSSDDKRKMLTFRIKKLRC